MQCGVSVRGKQGTVKEISFEAVYYEPESLNYELGRQLEEKFAGVPWIPIESHNSIKEMQEKPN